MSYPKSTASITGRTNSNVVQLIEKIVAALDKLLLPIIEKLNLISYITAGIMCVPVVCDVLCRILFHKSIPGIIEMEEFSLILIVFLGLAHVEAKRENIRIELLYAKFPKWLRHVMDSFIYLITAILFTIVSWQTILQMFKKVGVTSSALSIPISIFIGTAAVGLILLTVVLISNFLHTVVDVLQDGKWPFLIIVFGIGLFVILLPGYLNVISLKVGGLALGGLGVLFLFILMLLGMPIGFSMTLVGYIGLLLARKNKIAAFSMMGIAPYYSTSSYILAVVPLFILMGELALYSGISNDLFDTAYKWLGRLPGGLAMSAVAGCAGFAAVCGDSMATAVTMGTVALPEMKKKKYDPSIATGCLAAGGTLGILIPPSVGFIFYAIITEESVGRLFVAGIVPGVLLTLLFIGCIYLTAVRKPEMVPRGEAFTMREKLLSLKGTIGMLVLFVLILGGILGGFCSPTEGGAVGAFGAFLIAIIRRRLTRENLIKSFEETAKITCRLFIILIGVGVLGYFLAATQLPFKLAEVVTSLPVNRYFILGAVCILYIILGALMNVIPMIMLTLPAIFPSVVALGFDPVWFGVVIVILMEMGQITPPVGVNVYALSSTAGDIPMETIFKGIFPFFLCMCLMIILLIIFPQIATFLPNLMF